MRRTKIVATLGPASDTTDRIGELITAGVNVFRMNMSHGTHEEHRRRIEMVRTAAAAAQKPVGVLVDLQGPKIRTGSLRGGGWIELVFGQQFVITILEHEGTAEKVSTTYQALVSDVKPGNRILLSDGLIELQVEETSATEVITRVIHGGTLREHQGINLPGVNVSSPAMTEKDFEDLQFGLEHGADFIALSFVRRPEDITKVREVIAQAGKRTPVIAKIEKPEAIDHLDAIVAAVDGVMVARGDLGVEMRPEQVPLIQKRIILASNRAGKPVITATQMLESMIHNPRPTRAEASDVANAILDGTDAVMLSGETAVGDFPVETVKMMARIAEEAEQGLHMSDLDEVHRSPMRIDKESTAEAIAQAACAITRVIEVKAIVAFTLQGNTARLVSQYRPEVPILAFTPSEETYRRTSLMWGVAPLLCPYVERLDDLSAQVKLLLVAHGFAQQGDTVVMTGGHPLHDNGPTNLLKVMDI